MKIPFRQVVELYNERVWYFANRRSLGVWDADDIYQQTMLFISQQEFPEERTWSKYHQRWLDHDPRWVNRLIKSRTLDLNRLERRHAKRRAPAEAMVMMQDRVHVKEMDQADTRRLLRRLFPNITHRSLLILTELVTPSRKVVEFAIEDMKRAEKDRDKGLLRMNIHAPRVTQKHVARFINGSVTEISRTLGRAREAIELMMYGGDPPVF